MAQLNLNVTAEFEGNLARYMRIHGIKTKSEALRMAVKEGLQRAKGVGTVTDFGNLLGTGNQQPLNKNPKFASRKDLWK